MEFELDQGTLASLVSRAALGLAGRPILPVLAGVRLEAGEGYVEAAATDGDVWVRVREPAAVKEAGSALVPGKLLDSVVRSLEEGEVRVASGPGGVEIAGEPSRFVLRALWGDEFPALEAEEPAVGEMEGVDLQKAVHQVGRAAAKEEARPVLCGVLVEWGKDEATLVATDTYRLATRSVRAEGSAGEGRGVVPLRALQIVQRLATGRVRVALGERRAVFRGEGWEVGARTLGGEFPAWRTILPQQPALVVRAARKGLAEAVRRASLVVEAGRPVRLEVGPGGLTVRGEGAELGEAEERVPCQAQGEMVVGFNPGFLLDGLGALEGEEVELGLQAPLKAATVRDPEDPSFLYVVMPMRL